MAICSIKMHWYWDVISKLRYLLGDIVQYDQLKESRNISKSQLVLSRHLISQNRSVLSSLKRFVALNTPCLFCNSNGHSNFHASLRGAQEQVPCLRYNYDFWRICPPTSTSPLSGRCYRKIMWKFWPSDFKLKLHWKMWETSVQAHKYFWPLSKEAQRKFKKIHRLPVPDEWGKNKTYQFLNTVSQFILEILIVFGVLNGERSNLSRE